MFLETLRYWLDMTTGSFHFHWLYTAIASESSEHNTAMFTNCSNHNHTLSMYMHAKIDIHCKEIQGSSCKVFLHEEIMYKVVPQI